MKYIVTGGAGFIGSHIVDKLITLDHEVLILDNLSTGSESNINNKAKYINIDLCDFDKTIGLKNSVYGFDGVFHCAALPNVQYSVEFPAESNRVNVDTTINVLELMKIAKIKKIIYSGSCSVYGNAEKIPTDEKESIKPLSPYALQKYIGEEYCKLYSRMYNINYMILRYFNVYGERMSDKGAYISVLSHFIKSMKKDKILNITNDGNQSRDFVYVEDVAQANINAALADDSKNIVCNIGSGMDFTINQIAEWFGGEKRYGESRIEPKKTIADITLAKKILNWQPKQDLREWIVNQKLV